jgi:mannitol/fructose-specific phosphotransferase system IIA component (Ntr-type)
MRVSDSLRTDAIVTGMTWPDFGSAVEGLIDRLVQNGTFPAPLAQPAVESIVQRESVASTTMVDIGVSIPHSRIDGLESVISSLALSPLGVFGASAGTPISIVFLVLSPPSLAGEHLNFLSALSMLLHSPGVRRGLQLATSPEEALAWIRSHERGGRGST